MINYGKLKNLRTSKKFLYKKWQTHWDYLQLVVTHELNLEKIN